MEFFTIKNSVYLITNFFRIYVVYRFINVFFENNGENLKKEILGYLSYFLINSTIYFIYDSPVINLTNNIVLFFILTYLYEGQLSVRLIVTFLNIAMSIAFETLVYFICMEFKLSMNNLLILSNVIVPILLFISVLILEKYIKTNIKYKIKNNHFIGLLFVPIGSTILLVTTILSNNLVNNEVMIINISVVLVINFIVFYLYDGVIKSYDREYKNRVLKQQNKAYKNQFNIIKESNEKIRLIKHDFLNHLSAIYLFAKNNEVEKIIDYVSSMKNETEIDYEYIKTGNNEIDSILNYKIHEAKKLSVDVETKIKVPKDYNIAYFDLNIILGNLMDNAIEALKKVKEKRLYIEMKLDKGALYLKVVNTFNGEIRGKKNKLETLKSDKEFHGIGLKNVKKIVNKYKGTAKIKHSNNQFIIEILIFN